jgi:protein-tyrosine-phosphatase
LVQGFCCSGFCSGAACLAAARRFFLLRVAFVCTGNRARSPLAAALFSRHAGAARVEVNSYGALDLEGWPPLDTAIAVADGLGIDLRRHRSQTLRSGCLAETDLVVGFEPSHAAAAVEVGGAAPEHVFLLLELPALLEALPGSQLSEAADARVTIAAIHRLRAAAGSGSASSLPDPLGEPEQVLAEAARVIDAVTGALASAVLPGPAAVKP